MPNKIPGTLEDLGKALDLFIIQSQADDAPANRTLKILRAQLDDAISRVNCATSSEDRQKITNSLLLAPDFFLLLPRHIQKQLLLTLNYDAITPERWCFALKLRHALLPLQKSTRDDEQQLFHNLWKILEKFSETIVSHDTSRTVQPFFWKLSPNTQHSLFAVITNYSPDTASLVINLHDQLEQAKELLPNDQEILALEQRLSDDLEKTLCCHASQLPDLPEEFHKLKKDFEESQTIKDKIANKLAKDYEDAQAAILNDKNNQLRSQLLKEQEKFQQWVQVKLITGSILCEAEDIEIGSSLGAIVQTLQEQAIFLESLGAIEAANQLLEAALNICLATNDPSNLDAARSILQKTLSPSLTAAATTLGQTNPPTTDIFKEIELTTSVLGPASAVIHLIKWLHYHAKKLNPAKATALNILAGELEDAAQRYFKSPSQNKSLNGFLSTVQPIIAKKITDPDLSKHRNAIGKLWACLVKGIACIIAIVSVTKAQKFRAHHATTQTCKHLQKVAEKLSSEKAASTYAAVAG